MSPVAATGSIQDFREGASEYNLRTTLPLLLISTSLLLVVMIDAIDLPCGIIERVSKSKDHRIVLELDGDPEIVFMAELQPEMSDVVQHYLVSVRIGHSRSRTKMVKTLSCMDLGIGKIIGMECRDMLEEMMA